MYHILYQNHIVYIWYAKRVAAETKTEGTA